MDGISPVLCWNGPLWDHAVFPERWRVRNQKNGTWLGASQHATDMLNVHHTTVEQSLKRSSSVIGVAKKPLMATPSSPSSLRLLEHFAECSHAAADDTALAAARQAAEEVPDEARSQDRQRAHDRPNVPRTADAARK